VVYAVYHNTFGIFVKTNIVYSNFKRKTAQISVRAANARANDSRQPNIW
jgi:hypothetical protein